MSTGKCQFDAEFLAKRPSGSPGSGSGTHRVRRQYGRRLAWIALLVFGTACESTPAGAPAAAPVLAPGQFSGVAAWRDLQALAQLGPRPTGSRAAARARAYLRGRLEAIGAGVEEVSRTLPASEPGASPVEVTHLVATLPGESSDRFLLAAPYDTRAMPGFEFVGANTSASGPALVLELARALSHRSRSYTVVFAFVDGDRLPPSQPGAGFPGSRSFAAWLAQEEPEGGFENLRLALFFQQVADLDLVIARDLRSHPIYREFFWDAAGVLGREVSFPASARVESVDAGHVEFIEQGLPRTVVISDPRYGGSDRSGRYAGSEKDTATRCSPESLEIVGEVVLEALDRISVRLARIDGFHRSPLRNPPGAGAAPPARIADPAKPQTAAEPAASR